VHFRSLRVINEDTGSGRYAWLQMAKGAGSLNGTQLKQGDGAGVSDERALTLTASEDAEVLLFDLA
jgi:hypothetical protein